MRKNKQSKIFEAPAIKYFTQQPIGSPEWQRPLSWDVIHFVRFVNEWMDFAVAGKNSTMRTEEESSMFMFVTYVHDGVLYIADGQSRASSLNLFIKAFNDYRDENHVKCPKLPDIQMVYHHSDALQAYNAFLNNHELKRNHYARIYRYSKKRIEDFVNDGNDLNELYDVMMNNVSLEVRPCDNEPQAHEAFLNINTGGLDLTKNQIIDSILKFFSVEHSVQLEYDIDDLDEILAAYFYVTERDSSIDFNATMIHDFMQRNVVASPSTLREFRKYLLRIKAFKTNHWYQILNHIDREKSIRVAYALLAKGYDLNSSEVEEFLSAVYEYDVVSITRGSNTGGVTSTFFKDLLCWIGMNKSMEELIGEIVSKITMNPTKHQIHFADFDAGLDNLNDKVHKSIMLYTYLKFNANSRLDYDNIQEEHAFAQTNSPVWTAEGWPTDKDTRKVWIESLGNKFLLDAETNNAVKNMYIRDKGVYYGIFYKKNKGLSYDLNHFNAKKMEEQRYEYILERRAAYARFIANSTIGKLMVI